MIFAKSYGTASATVMGFLGIVVAPPVTFMAGIALLRRWKSAWFYVLLLLAFFLASNVWELLAPRPEVTTSTSASGVVTTTLTSYGSHSHHLPIAAICAVLLVKILSPSVRLEFGISQKLNDQPGTTAPPI